VLSEHEQKIWDDIVRDHRAGAGEALPSVVVGGGWGAVLLLLFGVPMAALAVAAASALIWVLWRFVPQLDTTGAADPQRHERGRRPVPHAHAEP
jgi:hypothetical protein